MAKELLSQGPAKGEKIRTQNDLELLKIILDSNPDLKKKVLRFMKKNYAKVIPRDAK